ncbi:MAG: hypothetical protein IT285_03355 [Bdellovibrionales bacterium]|nr:hypothetical protein [Bdellovibrionales bacterium]
MRSGTTQKAFAESEPEEFPARRESAQKEHRSPPHAGRHQDVTFKKERSDNSMPCYRPLRAWRAKRDYSKIVFKPSEGNFEHALQLPCGRCIGCRLEHSRQWAVRLEHERTLHDQAMFLTLTYAPEHLPPGGTLVKKHFQDFMKRFRAWLDEESGPLIRFYACGEYGEKLGRPHYHAIIFGTRFPDEVLFKTTGAGNKLTTSEHLERLWGHGFCTIGECTFESSAYVSRYVTKKRRFKTPEELAAYYGPRLPEFSLMSRRPGIASGWYEQFERDVFPCDRVVARGRQMKPPRYYDKLFELHHPEAMAELKTKRKERGIEAAQVDPPTPTRMKAKREYRELTTKPQLVRKYEHGQNETLFDLRQQSGSAHDPVLPTARGPSGSLLPGGSEQPRDDAEQAPSGLHAVRARGDRPGDG